MITHSKLEGLKRRCCGLFRNYPGVTEGNHKCLAETRPIYLADILMLLAGIFFVSVFLILFLFFNGSYFRR
jgi:hypothetical protein